MSKSHEPKVEYDFKNESVYFSWRNCMKSKIHFQNNQNFSENKQYITTNLIVDSRDDLTGKTSHSTQDSV